MCVQPEVKCFFSKTQAYLNSGVRNSRCNPWGVKIFGLLWLLFRTWGYIFFGMRASWAFQRYVTLRFWRIKFTWSCTDIGKWLHKKGFAFICKIEISWKLSRYKNWKQYSIDRATVAVFLGSILYQSNFHSDAHESA